MKNNEKVILDIIDDAPRTIKEETLISVVDMLPTGRPHISYSEMHDWIECQWRHKLKYIDKIDLDSESVHTLFGSMIHDALESYVSQPIDNRCAIDFEKYENIWLQEAIPNFTAKYEKTKPELIQEYLKSKSEFDEAIKPMLLAVPSWLDSQFPNWQIYGAEMKLYESIGSSSKRFFKGFIDCVIKVPNKKKQGEFLYYVLDWKTTSWGWSFDKKTSFNKQLQLVLYKHFLSKMGNIPMESIRCGFVLVKRKPPKSNLDAVCELVMVSVGPKTEEKALEIVSRMLMHLNKKLYAKNRMSCKYCKYNMTEHCT